MTDYMEDAKYLASGAYTGAADIGKVSAIIGAAAATLVGGIFTVTGIELIINPGPDPNNPRNLQSRFPGYILAFMGLAVIIFAWVMVWLSQKYKIVAAMGGAETISRLF